MNNKWKEKQIRKVIDQVSDEHFNEAAKFRAGRQRMQKEEKKGFWHYLGYALVAACIIAVIGAATINIQNHRGTQTANEDPSNNFYDKLMEQLIVEKDELLVDRYQREGDIRKVLKVSEIYSGSFTGADKEEILVLFRFCETTSGAGGFDRVISAIYDEESIKIEAQDSFAGDDNTVYILEGADGTDLILRLSDEYGQGGLVSQRQVLYRINDGKFIEDDPLSSIRGGDEFSDYSSFLTKYCVLAGDNTLLIYDVSGTIVKENLDFELVYKFSSAVKWNSELESFVEQEKHTIYNE